MLEKSKYVGKIAMVKMVRIFTGKGLVECKSFAEYFLSFLDEEELYYDTDAFFDFLKAIDNLANGRIEIHSDGKVYAYGAASYDMLVAKK